MEGSVKRKIIVVCGPTATGKTKLAITLARRFSGEMIGADSMQVYKGLVIGTAAPTPEETDGVPLHLIGFLPPGTPFSVADYVKKAHVKIENSAKRKHLPIVCGGTGLYIESLIKGISFTEKDTSAEVRKQLQQQWDAEGGEAMLFRLAQCDPKAAAELHPKDKTRVLRALEQTQMTGTTKEQRANFSVPQAPPYDALCIGLMYKERSLLYQHINSRVDAMLAAGLLEEAKEVYRHKDSFKTAAQAIGYKEFFLFFEGGQPLEICVEKLKQATRNYAKRQLTWFRHMRDIQWLAPEEADCEQRAEKLVGEFLTRH